MRALIGRGLIILCFVLAIIAPTASPYGYLVAGLLALAFWLVASSQRAVWMDGWNAAHEHHSVEGDPDEHMTEYRLYLSRQGWHD